MSDLYTELIVKRKTPVIDQVKKFGLIILAVLAVAAGLLTGNIIAWGVALAAVVACYFLIPRFDLEYEYLYVNGELDIDKIMSKSKRKRICSLDTKNLEILAPADSHYLDSFNNSSSIKTLDFSSGEEGHKVYAMILNDEKGAKKVLFEPNMDILNDIKKYAPRKVIIE